MPQVTAITKQRRHETRFSVAVDGVYAFSLSDLDLSASSLRVGSQLSELEVAEWQARAGSSKAYNQAVGYISLRLRSEQELRQYLRRKGYDDGITDEIIERLRAISLLDDAKFAAAYVRDRQIGRPRSASALRFELAKRGVNREVIDEVLASELASDGSAALELARRKRRQYPDDSKLMAYLARQGFRYDEVRRALEQLAEESA
jgi:regulatory protein